MHIYLITMLVDGKRTETTVKANIEPDARKLAEAQYKGCKVQIISVKRLD